MEKPKGKSSNIFQTVADRLSKFFHKEESQEQETTPAPADVVEPEQEKPRQEMAVRETKSKAEVKPEAKSVPVVEHSRRKASANPERPRRRRTSRRKKSSRRSVAAGPTKKKAEKVVHEDYDIPVFHLPKKEIGPAIHDFVIEHISDLDLSVDMMASKLKTSRTGLYTFMHSEFDKTPANYILDLRLEYAVSLLEKGMKVSQVSTKCGFSDPKYFSKVFKKHFGILPSSYGEHYKHDQS